jgi:hypothetical protein
VAFAHRPDEGPARLLICMAAWFVPRNQRERYHDEWLSTLDDMRAEHLPTLRFAITTLLHGPTFRRSATKNQRRTPARVFVVAVGVFVVGFVDVVNVDVASYVDSYVVGFVVGHLIRLVRGSLRQQRAAGGSS